MVEQVQSDIAWSSWRLDWKTGRQQIKKTTARKAKGTEDYAEALTAV